MRSIVLLLCVFGLTFASGFSAPPSATYLFKRPSSVTRLSSNFANPAISLGHSMPRGGGALKAADGGSADTKCPFTTAIKLTSSMYGTGGVMYILIKAIRRVVPIALEPFTKGAVPLTQVQLGAYVATCVWFAYVEGYKGFQTKFAPLVVSRSLTLDMKYSKFHHYLFAPFYSMGLFHATKKRMIVSWSVTLGVAGIVAAVKKLPYPYRNIVDAGVVAGLTWGCVSILVHYIKALVTGKAPADPVLPP